MDELFNGNEDLFVGFEGCWNVVSGYTAGDNNSMMGCVFGWKRIFFFFVRFRFRSVCSAYRSKCFFISFSFAKGRSIA